MKRASERTTQQTLNRKISFHLFTKMETNLPYKKGAAEAAPEGQDKPRAPYSGSSSRKLRVPLVMAEIIVWRDMMSSRITE